MQQLYGMCTAGGYEKVYNFQNTSLKIESIAKTWVLILYFVGLIHTTFIYQQMQFQTDVMLVRMILRVQQSITGCNTFRSTYTSLQHVRKVSVNPEKKTRNLKTRRYLPNDVTFHNSVSLHQRILRQIDIVVVF